MSEIELFLKECQDKLRNKDKLACLDRLSKRLDYLPHLKNTFIHFDMSSNTFFNYEFIQNIDVSVTKFKHFDFF